MRCQDVKIQLQAFSIGELPMAVRQAILAHLSDCAACMAELAKIDALARMGAAAQTPPIPAGFSARVMAMARQRRENDLFETWNLVRWWHLTTAPMHAAAAAVLVVGLAIGLVMGAASCPLIAPDPTTAQPDPVDTYPLDYLGEAPGGSLADNYFALASTTSEGGR